MAEYGAIPPGSPTLPSAGDSLPEYTHISSEYIGKPFPLPDPEQPLLQDKNTIKRKRLLGRAESTLTIFCISCITLISCFLGGVVTIVIPQIARDLNLDSSVELWPVSMYALSTGCTLLLSGSISDVIGSRTIFLLGCWLQSIFSLACGLSQTGVQLITFRILSGLATSLCLPSAVSIITENFPPGKYRNLAFASMGGGQPIGFGIGIIVGGLFADTIGWTWGFHIVAIINTLVCILSVFKLPKKSLHAPPVSWDRLAFGIDWIGALLASTSLALLSYVLSIITENASDILKPSNVIFLSTSAVLIVGFVLWVGRQERLGRPALIANSLWKNSAFSVICFNVFMIWGAFNAFEQIINFFFQDVQLLSASETGWRFLPTPISGTLSSIATGLVLHRMRADSIVNITTILSCISPLLMALVNPVWTYWACPFTSIFLNSIGADSLFTVSNIVIASVFPAEMQGLAGGVFNTISQIGKSFGLALVALISNTVTDASSHDDKKSPEALMEGYRIAFWFLFAMNISSLAASVVGLRRVGNVGREAAHH